MGWQTVGFKLKYQKKKKHGYEFKIEIKFGFILILIYTRTCGETAPAPVRHEWIPVNIDPTPAAGSLWSGSHDSLTPPSVDFQPLDFLRPCQEAAVDVCEIPRVHREQNGGGGGWRMNIWQTDERLRGRAPDRTPSLFNFFLWRQTDLSPPLENIYAAAHKIFAQICLCKYV